MRISPRASPALVEVLVRSQEMPVSAGLNHDVRLQHFLSEILTETGGLQRIAESLNYRANRLTKVFGVPQAVAVQLEGKEQETANYVYGNKLGNHGRDTDDGWTYRGSGFIQLTGRYNFRQRGLELKLPLESVPEQVRQPLIGLQAAIAYWTAKSINKVADTDDVSQVRARINPALEGLEAARVWRARVARVLSNSESGGEDIGYDDPSGLLRAYGLLSKAAEASGTDSVQTALRSYQREHGLFESGVFDQNTFYALIDPSEWRGTAPLPVELNQIPLLRRSGIIFDLHTGLSRVLPAGNDKVGSTSYGGTGAEPLVPSLSVVEEGRLIDALPVFAPYEELGGLRDAVGSFVPFTVIEPDQRVVVPMTTAFPASAVVQLLFRRNARGETSICTGAMIAKNVVLTAGHCVNDGGPTGRWHRDIVVIPGRNGPVAPFGQCAATKLYSVTGWVEATGPDEGRLHDLGAVKLDCDVGRQTGWFKISALADAAVPIPITILGYPTDLPPAGKQWRSEGSIELLTATKMFYRNSTYGGMSGAPLLVDKADSIVGIHTNGLHGAAPWDTYNAATRLSKDAVVGLVAFIEE